jgi:hypothetical protein
MTIAGLKHGAYSVILAVCALVTLPTAGHSDELNSWVRGSRKQLERIIAEADASPCGSPLTSAAVSFSPRCELQIEPIALSVKSQTSRGSRIMLTSAEVAAPLADPPSLNSGLPAGNSATLRRNGPVLLRGWLRPHGVTDKAFPVAAVILRSSVPHRLLITTPDIRRSAEVDTGRLSSLRVALQDISRPFRRNSRTGVVSRSSLPNLQCGTPLKYAISEDSYVLLKDSPFASRTTYPTLYIATDFDAQFSSRIRCSSVAACNDALISTIHSAAVFYENQLGYTFTVARQFGPTSIGDATDPSDLLDVAQQLSLQPRFSIIHTGSHTAANQIDLVQFFTGRTMDEKTIGIAYVGTTCRNDRSPFSLAIVQHVSSALDPVTTAHEIGHTLNASHTDTGIMRPSLSNNTPKSFSSASLLEISGYLDTWYSECRRGFSRGIVSPTPTPRGGGPSPANPHIGKPVTLGLSAKSLNAKSVTFSATVTSLSPQCSVSIRGGVTSIGAHRGEVLTTFVPAALTTLHSGRTDFRVKPTSAAGPDVFFVAEHSCSDGTVVEVSRVQRFNPNRIRGLSRLQKSKREWLSSLRQSIQANSIPRQ